jgi:protein ImuB
MQRFANIWFPHLMTDWFSIRRPELRNTAFVLAAPDHGRMIITAANPVAQWQGIVTGMAVADARAILPSLQVLDDMPGQAEKLLDALGKWCIRFTPVTAVDLPDGLILDASGCAHLWGGEMPYLEDISTRLKNAGYHVRAAMADTIGAAWAMAHFGKAITSVIPAGGQREAVLPLAPAALRLEPPVVERLHKLGLHHIGSFISMQRAALRRRFGVGMLLRLDQVTGLERENIQPLVPLEPYQERLPCLEPIITRRGIEIALERLLQALCQRLQQEGKGIRTAVLKCYRIDGKIEQAGIGTNRASHNVDHLFKLFTLKINEIGPEPGIELFILEAPKVEDVRSSQEALWRDAGAMEEVGLAELLDRLAAKAAKDGIRRYVPDEHHWPERSIKLAASLGERPAIPWRTDRPRPIRLLAQPEPVMVAAPIPDYPPILFRYKGVVHDIKKADGPERIEREWWLEEGKHRDYYCVEDQEGRRYWLFRSGHYDLDNRHTWFIHGFFS